MILALLIASFLSAAIPCALVCLNLRRYLPPPPAAPDLPAVSLLIPARNEAEGIAEALASALASRSLVFEVIIMDDASTDATAAIVLAHAARDPRVRLERAPPLPPGWNGKQHACWALAQAARNPILCFVDADVRLDPNCIARMATFLTRTRNSVLHSSQPHRDEWDPTSTPQRIIVPERVEAGGFSPLNTPTPEKGALAPANSALISGFPRQLTGSPLEWLLLPLIHFVLLGFLPLGRMRKTTNPGCAAGCGQFLLCDREAYFACGGHSNIKLTMHDGLRLPRLFREHGYHTDLADITDLARVRMYTNARDTWQGLAKNATEGLGAPARIIPITLILLLGQVLPFAMFVVALAPNLNSTIILDLFIEMPTRLHGHFTPWELAHLRLLTLSWTWGPTVLWLLIVLIAWLPRILAARRFRQNWRSALFHPVGILLLLAVQWYALLRKLRGGQVSWRGRAYIKTSA